MKTNAVKMNGLGTLKSNKVETDTVLQQNVATVEISNHLTTKSYAQKLFQNCLA